MTGRDSITSAQLTRIPEDAIDQTLDSATPTAFMKHDAGSAGDVGDDPNALTPTRSEVSTVADSEPGETELHAYAAEVSELPRVDIMQGPGIWVCLDEGCNSNCHCEDWARNAEHKLNKAILKQGFEWVHRRERRLKGGGGAEVMTKGERSWPTAFLLTRSKKALPGVLESHEQPGTRPLLLSDASRAR